VVSYDDWKCSPPCPTCGTPNCICDDEGGLDEEELYLLQDEWNLELLVDQWPEGEAHCD
jgi:hypothetical protein